MKGIWTKFLPATNSRGSRIKAEAECGPSGKTWSVTVSADHALSTEKAHDAAALALCAKMGWPGDLMRGGRPDGRGYVYAFVRETERVSNPVPSYEEQARARAAAKD